MKRSLQDRKKDKPNIIQPTRNKNKLRVAYINAENAKNKTSEILSVIGGGGSIEKLDILGIGETWDDGTISSNSSYKWFNRNSPPPGHKHQGVGAFVRNGLACFTSVLDDISDHRVMWLQILTKNEALYVAVVYCSPNNISDLEEVLLNIEKNQNDLSKCGKVLVMGDLNGRMGGITGDSLTNERGKMIIKLSKQSGLRIIKSPQPIKWTFYHKYRGQSVIDIIMLNEGKGHSVSHYQAHGSGSSIIGFGSDHRLVTFHWNIWETELATQADWKQEKRFKVDWTEQTKTEYEEQSELVFENWNSLHATTLHNTKGAKKLADDLREKLRTTILPFQTSHNAPPKNKRHQHYAPHLNQGQNSLETKRDLALSKIKENQNEATRSEISKKINDLQKQIVKKAQSKETSRQKKLWDTIINKKTEGLQGDYWKMIKQLRTGSQDRFTSMIRQDGLNIVGNKAITNEFAKAYTEVYNGLDDDAKTYRSINAENEYSQNTESRRAEISSTFNKVTREIHDPTGDPQLDAPMDLAELDEAIKAMQKGKAVGEDAIPIEAILYGGKLVRGAVLDTFRALWQSGSTPISMQKGQVVPVFKGGDSSNTKNFRPITLLNCVFKLYEKVLERRLRTVVKSNGGIPDIQKGAIPNTGTNEALFTILSTLADNQSTPATLALLDLSKAYDRVWRKGLWAKLWELGIKGRLLRAVMSTYSQPELEVKMGTTSSDAFVMRNGLRQGSVLSPLLFILLFTDMVKESKSNTGLFVETDDGPEEITGQCFVDDTILMASTPREIIGQIDSFNTQAAIWGSVLNLHKTKIISNRSLESISQWMTDNQVSRKEGQAHAKYLGVWISVKNNSCSTHFKYAMAKANSTILRLKSIGVRIGAVSIEEGLELIRRLVIPQLTYAAEVLCPSQSVIDKVDQLLMKAVATVMPIYENCKPKLALWEAGIEDFETMLDKAKLRFHHKLSVANEGATRYYTEGNYLTMKVNELLEKYSLTTFTKQTLKDMVGKKKGGMSKASWKKKVNTSVKTQRELSLSQTNPFLALTKPTAGLEMWMESTDPLVLKSFLKTRHGAWGPRACKCDGKTHRDVVGHFFKDCKSIDTVIAKIVLLQTMDDELTGFEQLETIEKVYALLGGPLPPESNEDRGNPLWKILLAEFMSEAELTLYPLN
jgi:hypothetical protein